MIDEGIIFNISIILNKLERDISNPILPKLLWMLEDFAALEDDLVQVMIEHGLHTRIMVIFKRVVDAVSRLQPFNSNVDRD